MTQCRVTSPWVVPALNLGKYRQPGIASGRPAVAVDQLALQAGKEAFCTLPMDIWTPISWQRWPNAQPTTVRLKTYSTMAKYKSPPKWGYRSYQVSFGTFDVYAVVCHGIFVPIAALIIHIDVSRTYQPQRIVCFCPHRNSVNHRTTQRSTQLRCRTFRRRYRIARQQNRQPLLVTCVARVVA